VDIEKVLTELSGTRAILETRRDTTGRAGRHVSTLHSAMGTQEEEVSSCIVKAFASPAGNRSLD
jgi:hypothetical protein